MIYFLWDGVSKTGVDIFRTVMFTLSETVCRGIMFAFDLFIRLGRAQIVTSSQVQTIFSRVSLILGIFMLFRLTFSFVQYLINPETMSDKSRGAGKLVMRCLIVVVLLGSTPFLFSQAYKIQNLILDSNFLGKVIIGKDYDSSVEDFGSDLASSLFLTFYYYEEGYEGSCKTDVLSENMEELEFDIKYYGSFGIGSACLNESQEEGALRHHTLSDGYKIHFSGNGIVLLLVSGFVLYILINYCISVGLRIVQLAFLQLIAPIPIMAYIGEDKDSSLGRWGKRVLSTFLDLFIRLAIIYFAVFLIKLILDSNSNSYYYLLSTTGNPTGWTRKLLVVCLILGILMFAKKAPDLIKDVLPKGVGDSDFGIGLGKKFDNMVGGKRIRALPGKALGFGAGALAGGTLSAIDRFNTNRRLNKNPDGTHKKGWARSNALGMLGGLASGAFHGAAGGIKDGNVIKNLKGIGSAISEQGKRDDKYTQMRNANTTTFDKIKAAVGNKLFGETDGQYDTRRINHANKMAGYRDRAMDAVEKIRSIQDATENLAHLPKSDWESIAAYDRRHDRDSKALDNQKDATFEAILNGAKSGDTIKWERRQALNLERISNPMQNGNFNISAVSGTSQSHAFAFDTRGDDGRVKTEEEIAEQLKAQLDSQIALMNVNGIDTSSIDVSSIMSDFRTAYNNGEKGFAYSLGLSAEDNAKMQFINQLDASIDSYQKAGGKSSVDRSAIIASFETALANGDANFAYTIGTSNDYKEAARVQLGKDLQSARLEYASNGANASDLAEMDTYISNALANFDANWASTEVSGEFEYDIMDNTRLIDQDDRRIAQAEAAQAEAVAFENATGATYIDPTTGNEIAFNASNAAEFRSAKKRADNTVSAIVKNKDYQKHIAADKAANVDSNATSVSDK